jgi:hypothetical protein
MIDPSEKEPRASGLYRVVSRNSRLSASGSTKAQKSHRVTLSRFVDKASTKCGMSSFERVLFVIFEAIAADRAHAVKLLH